MRKVDHILRQVHPMLTHVEQITHTCDWCQKQVVEGEPMYGGSYTGGWFHVGRAIRGTALEELRREREWDFCGFECLSWWINDGQTRDKHA